jgi:hypothetical protein
MLAIDVEKAFADFVRSFGGEVLEDAHGTSLSFSNADYVFHSENVIGELKRLVDNKDKNEDIQAKVQAKFDRWMLDGTIGPIYGRVVVNSHSLPERCQRELIDLFKPALQKRILKANKQIKQTASFLGLNDAKGLVFIANDGNYALEADAAVYLIGRILGTNCKAINSVVYFTVNMFASSPATEKPTLVWVHANRKAVVDPVSIEFVMKLFDGWRDHVANLRNESIETITGNFPELDRIRYGKQT